MLIYSHFFFNDTATTEIYTLSLHDALPISLFRSRDFVNSQTELMVLVTPYVVRAVAQKDLSRPDDGFANASDPQADFLRSINRIYGVRGRVEPARNYPGTYDFITDSGGADHQSMTGKKPGGQHH